MSTLTIKDHVKGQVTFQFYRDGSLWYKTDSGFQFPVPIEDIGNATFLATDKAILFMRYIRPHMKLVESGDNAFGVPRDV